MAAGPPPPPYESVISGADSSHPFFSVPTASTSDNSNTASDPFTHAPEPARSGHPAADPFARGPPNAAPSNGTDPFTRTTPRHYSNNGSGAAQAMSAPSTFDITVYDPVKTGEGVSAHVSYKVRTRTTHPRYSRQTFECVRRFRDFTALAEQMAEHHKGVIIPPLPEKSTVQKFGASAEFIEARRRALQVFVNRVAAHPVLRDSDELQVFLEMNDEEWMLQTARWSGEAAGRAAPVSGAVAWLKNLGHTATSLMSGRRDDTLEDPEYIKVRDYVNHLETHLAEAQRQAARLVKKESDLGTALADFGSAAEQLGKLDSSGALRPAFDALHAKASSVGAMGRSHAAALAERFEAPLKEAARSVRSVQAAMADRASALAAATQAKSELDSRKVRLAKLQGMPNAKEEAVAAAVRDVNEAEQRVRNTRTGYEAMVSCMTEELNRFQKERAAEMSNILRDFAVAQAQLASEQAQAWNSFLINMQQHSQPASLSS